MSTENTTFFITRHFDKITTVKNGKHSTCFTQNEIDTFDKIFILLVSRTLSISEF